MSDVCHYKLIGGQFCGGYFWETECGQYFPVEKQGCTICLKCGKQVEIIEDDDE